MLAEANDVELIMPEGKSNEAKLAAVMALNPAAYLITSQNNKQNAAGTKVLTATIAFYNKKKVRLTSDRFVFHGKDAEQQLINYEANHLSKKLKKNTTQPSSFKPANQKESEYHDFITTLNKDKASDNPNRFDTYYVVKEKDNTLDGGTVQTEIIYSSKGARIELPRKRGTFPDMEAFVKFKEFLGSEGFQEQLLRNKKIVTGRQTYN